MSAIRLFLLLIFTTALLAEDRPLPVDPAITSGELANGLRYHIRPNRAPEGKVSILLHVHSGSLNETEDQRGLAHFLEHMAFNGSEHFPPGEMVKFFESLGMRFGQHQNAFTGFDQTTYLMHLPDTKPETLDKVFVYFGDVGWRLHLLPEEIEKERGVILEEARSRAGVGQRIGEKALPILMPGARIPNRLPIGLEKVIKEAKRDRFAAYYEKWYRPENSTVIVCGDIDVDGMKKRIEATFAEWKPAAKKAEQAKPGVRPHEQLRAAVLTDPELTQTRIGLGLLTESRPMRTVADFRASLVDSIGNWIVNRRLRQMLQKGEAPFQGASVSTREFLNASFSADIDASGEPGKWREMLTAAIAEVKKARVHGFSDTEIGLAKKSLLSGAEERAQAEPTRQTQSLVMALNRAVTEGRLPMSRAQSLELYRELLPTIQPDEVVDRFRRNYPLDRGVVMATMPEKEGVENPDDAELLAVAKKALAAEVEKKKEEKAAVTLLEKDPEPARPASRSLDEDLQIETLVFPNGVRVHCRSMDYRKDQVRVMVRFVGGRLDETAKTAQLTGAAASAFTGRTAATKRHSPAQLSDLLTGKKVGFGGGPSDGGFGVSVGGSPQDLEFGMRLLHVLLTEARLDAVAFERWKKRARMSLPQMEKDARFQTAKAVTELLSGNDPRLAMMSAERLDAIEREAVQAWIEKILATAPIEASIVGDLPRERMVELASRYLGTLPARAVERDDLAERRKVKQDEGPMVRHVKVETITPMAQVELGWRGAAFDNRVDRRILVFASQIAAARLNNEIREARGLTYSIGASVRPGAFDGMGRFLVQFTADPAKAAEAAKVARTVVEDMRGDAPPTDEEMAAVRKQIGNVIKEQLQRPAFWADTLTTLLTNKRSLDDLKSLEQDYLSITKKQVADALARYIVDERYYEVIAAPEAEAGK